MYYNFLDFSCPFDVRINSKDLHPRRLCYSEIKTP